jgi:hypothetical protein
MKMSLGNQPYLDQNTGLPVEGRIKVYHHGTNVFADLYTIEGSQYVVAPNPQLLHGGYPDASLFIDLGIVDVVLEKYIGAEGQMSILSPDSDFAQIDVFEAGLDYDLTEATADKVDTMADLREANTDLGLVQVTWYSEPGDCCPRTYVWDPLSQNEEDGGYIIRSDNSDTGRWILLWGDEVLPCTVYGVRPGDESNMNLLLNYPETVGSFALQTAPCVRFLPGTYTSTVGFATPKQLCFDKGAQFPYSSFICHSLRMFNLPTSYVSDFSFTSKLAEAHSSWFRTAAAFLTCGAARLIVDKDNYFADSQIRSLITLENQTIEFVENTRLPITYVNNGRLKLSKVNIVGTGVFNATDKISFAYTDFKDDWFSQAGADIDFANFVQCRGTSLNTLRLDNFKSVQAYVNAIRYDGQTLLDLAGRRISGLAVSTFTEIRNVFCDTLNIQMNGQDVVLDNVHCGTLVASCRYLTVQGGSDVHFEYEPFIDVLTGTDSRIASGIKWQRGDIYVNCQKCYIGITFDYRMGDNTTVSQVLRFYDCLFQQNAAIYAKRLEMWRCVTDNNPIKVYPYKDDGVYYLDAIFEGNTFNSNVPIELTKFDVINGVADEDCYDIMLKVKIIGNQFYGNDDGVSMRYWQNRAGNYSLRTFIKEAGGHQFEYSGNSGKCPAESMRGVMVSDNSAYITYELNGAILYKYTGSWKRVAVDPNYSTTWWYSNTVDANETCVKYYNWVNSPYDSLTYDLFVQNVNFYRKGRDFAAGMGNGDYFSLALGTLNDYIRIVQSGDNDHNHGIVAKVV